MDTYIALVSAKFDAHVTWTINPRHRASSYFIFHILFFIFIGP